MFESFALFQSDLDSLGAKFLEMELQKQHSSLLPLPCSKSVLLAFNKFVCASELVNCFVCLALPWQPRGILLAFEWCVQQSYVFVWKEKHCLALGQPVLGRPALLLEPMELRDMGSLWDLGMATAGGGFLFKSLSF